MAQMAGVDLGFLENTVTANCGVNGTRSRLPAIERVAQSSLNRRSMWTVARLVLYL